MYFVWHFLFSSNNAYLQQYFRCHVDGTADQGVGDVVRLLREPHIRQLHYVLLCYLGNDNMFVLTCGCPSRFVT